MVLILAVKVQVVVVGWQQSCACCGCCVWCFDVSAQYDGVFHESDFKENNHTIVIRLY